MVECKNGRWGKSSLIRLMCPFCKSLNNPLLISNCKFCHVPDRICGFHQYWRMWNMVLILTWNHSTFSSIPIFGFFLWCCCRNVALYIAHLLILCSDVLIMWARGMDPHNRPVLLELGFKLGFHPTNGSSHFSLVFAPLI